LLQPKNVGFLGRVVLLLPQVPVFPSTRELINEPAFNPLEANHPESELEFELENVSSDKSLEGHDEEWLDCTKKSRTGGLFHHPLV
jgi:hypothetical protein